MTKQHADVGSCWCGFRHPTAAELIEWKQGKRAIMQTPSVTEMGLLLEIERLRIVLTAIVAESENGWKGDPSSNAELAMKEMAKLALARLQDEPPANPGACGHAGTQTVLACVNCGVVVETPSGITGAGRDALKSPGNRPCPLCGRTDNHTHTAGPFGMT